MSDPMFHQDDRFRGAGRSIREVLIGLVSGWVFRRGCISPKTELASSLRFQGSTVRY